MLPECLENGVINVELYVFFVRRVRWHPLALEKWPTQPFRDHSAELGTWVNDLPEFKRGNALYTHEHMLNGIVVHDTYAAESRKDSTLESEDIGASRYDSGGGIERLHHDVGGRSGCVRYNLGVCAEEHMPEFVAKGFGRAEKHAHMHHEAICMHKVGMASAILGQ